LDWAAHIAQNNIEAALGFIDAVEETVAFPDPSAD